MPADENAFEERRRSHPDHGPFDIPGRPVAGIGNARIAAPIILLLRTLQGLALGGEYGGAATHVANTRQRTAAALET